LMLKLEVSNFITILEYMKETVNQFLRVRQVVHRLFKLCFQLLLSSIQA